MHYYILQVKPSRVAGYYISHLCFISNILDNILADKAKKHMCWRVTTTALLFLLKR